MKIEHHLPLATPKSYLLFRALQCQVPETQPKVSISSIWEGSAKYFMLNSLGEKKLHPKMFVFHKLLLIA